MREQVTVDSHFTDISYEIKRELRNAKESIWICVAWISFRAYQDILLQKIVEGVDVQILCNGDYINHKNLNHIVHPLLLDKILLVRNPIPNALVHHKFCIIDDSTLINGSFNWSDAAYYHYENLTVIKNDYKSVNKFKHEFRDLYLMAYQSNLGASFPKINKKTSTFILGMISEPHGIYENVTLQQWYVDLSTNRCRRMGSIDIQHFYNQISTGLPDNDDNDFGYFESKEYYIEVFNRERNQINVIQEFFDIRQNKVHAIGRAIKTQDHNYDDEEPLIDIIWSDVRYRKIVPDTINIDGDFDTVFDESYFAGT